MSAAPRWLERLVERRLASDPHADSTVGDLAEGYAWARARRGRATAVAWYVRQAISLALRGTAPTGSDRRTRRMTALLWIAGSAVRRARRRPGFAAAVSGVLALAIGATLAAFSVTAGTWDAAHAWADEGRAVVIWPEYRFARGHIDVLRGENEAFEAVGGLLRRPAVVSLDDRTAATTALEVSTDLFSALRAQPVLGRGLLPEDGERDAEPVVVLGHALWRSAFGGSREAIGRLVEINGIRRRVVGVMPPGAAQPGPGTELWMPLVLDTRDPDYWPRRELEAAGIMAAGTTVQEARDDVRRMMAGLAQRFPFFFRPDFGSDATVFAAAERSWGAVATPLLLLLAGSLLLLVVAAIDVGNLVLARSLERRTELRVRVAIGASRGQVIAQILAEAALQTGLAALVGAVLGIVVGARVPGLFPVGTAVVALGATDPRLVLFLGAVALSAWALTAGIPTAHFLATTRRVVAPRFARNGAARVLVVAQAGLSTLLMVCAALLLRTVQQLDRLPLGFEPEGVTVAAVGPPTSQPTAGSILQLQDAVAGRLAALPGTRATGWISAVPLLDPVLQSPINREEQQVQVAEAPTIARFVLDPGALDALGLEILAGRGLRSGDDGAAAPVALVNRTMARQLWPDTDPVGRRIAIDPHGWQNWITIVGVVEDLRFADLTRAPEPAFFLPRAQAPTSAMSLLVASRSEPPAVGTVLRAALADLAPDAAPGAPRPLVSVVHDAQGPARVMTSLLTLLAALAAALGAVGLYGSLAGWVTSRQAEIGTRLALGASPGGIAKDILATAAALSGSGIALGALAAALAARAFRTLLFGISPLDPLAFTIPAAVLLVVGIAAALVPAIRAAAVPPAQALRT